MVVVKERDGKSELRAEGWSCDHPGWILDDPE